MAKILKGPPRNKKPGGKPEVAGSTPNQMDYWGEMGTPQGYNSPAKDFLEPGKNFSEMLFRSVIPDEKTGNAILRLHSRFVKFDDKIHDQMLKDKLAELAARYGRARTEALFGTINMISPDMFNQIAWWLPKSEKKSFNVASNQQKVKREETEEEDI